MEKRVPRPWRLTYPFVEFALETKNISLKEKLKLSSDAFEKQRIKFVGARLGVGNRSNRPYIHLKDHQQYTLSYDQLDVPSGREQHV